MSDPDARLVRALEQLGAEHEPPPGWQARVLAAVDPGPRRRRSWWWLAIPVVAAAAGAVLLLVLPRPEPLTLTVVVERSAHESHTRGDMLPVGSWIHAVARGGERHHAIWVYRNSHELIAACPGPAACRRAGGELTMDLTLELIGTYQVVAWSSAEEVPEPRGGYDADFAAATAAGATWKVQEIEAR